MRLNFISSGYAFIPYSPNNFSNYQDFKLNLELFGGWGPFKGVMALKSWQGCGDQGLCLETPATSNLRLT